jgi:ferric-dicitrate binding protein FerR (iron transport regulator)
MAGGTAAVSDTPDPPEGEGDPSLEVSLERGLHRQPLDASALARIRAAAQAEFEKQHGHARARRFDLRRVSLAAALLLAIVAAALTLRPVPEGPVIGSIARIENGAMQAKSGWLVHHALAIGSSLHAGESCEVSGTALVSLAHGGTFRVAPGSTFEINAPDELFLRAGRVYFDFPAGGHAFLLRAAAGTVEHLGTQFEVALMDGGMRVRVREGAVRVRAGSNVERAEAGAEVLVQQSGTILRHSAPTYGPDWAWVETLATDFDIENRPLADFLMWVARETGHRIEFADDRARELAESTRLHGSVHGLLPLEALDRVLSTTTLRSEVHGDTIRVSSRR